jgi:Ca2+-binding EF-hand superfamily protein
MHTKNTVLLILGAILLPLATHAQSGNGQPNGKKGQPPAPAAVIERLDADQSGGISMDEAKGRMAERFDRIDADGNGQITEQELAAAHKKGKEIAGKAENKMRAIDTDSNGTISRSEATAGGLQKIVENFEAIDSDGDGELSKTEMRQYRKAYKEGKGKNASAKNV